MGSASVPDPWDGRARLPPASNERLIEPDQLASLVFATNHLYESQGHAPPNYLVRVSVSPEAVEAYRTWGPGASMPKGTWLVASHVWRDHIERHQPNLPEPTLIYTMYRGPNGWLFGAATAEGWRIPVDEGVCQDCHTQAKSDLVFGPPVEETPLRQ